MGIMDAFKPEDRTEITYSNFYNLIKQAAQYEIVMNAVNCDVPHDYIPEDNDREERGTQRRKAGHGSGKRKLWQRRVQKNHGRNDQRELRTERTGRNTGGSYTGRRKTGSRNKKAHDRESKEERNEEPWRK